MATKLHNIRLSLPRWITALYLIIAIGLVPWIFVLSATLPARHLSRHWDLAWVGFDMMMLLAVMLTALFAFRRSWWVSLSSMSVFTLLIVDGWFDILTARPGMQTLQAVLLALLVELPLALVSLWLSYRVARDLVKISG